MKGEYIMNTTLRKNILILCYSAVLTALCCIATMIIQVPTVVTSGYVNIGDAMVLVSAWLLGNPYGALAAGLGTALADILSSYVSYAPGTFVIKFTMALVCALIYKFFSKLSINKYIAYLVGAVVAEVIMVAGYFVYEAFILGYGFGALESVGGNAIQAIVCLVIGFALISALPEKLKNICKDKIS